MKNTVIKTILSRCLLLLMAASMGSFLFLGGARGAKSDDRTVLLTVGKADTIELASAVADVLVANPAIADVGTLRSNRLYMVGHAIGDTNVLAYDDVGNQLANITIHVRADDKTLQSALKEFFPDEKIAARTLKDNVILSGFVSSPSVSSQVRDLATRFLIDKTQTIVDLMKVRGIGQKKYEEIKEYILLE